MQNLSSEVNSYRGSFVKSLGAYFIAVYIVWFIIYSLFLLFFKTLFTWIFWITLRQHVREKKLRRRQVAESGEVMLSTLARPIVKAFKRRGREHGVGEISVVLNVN